MPTVPAGGSTGCWHTARRRAGPSFGEWSLSGLHAVAANLVWELADADRLFEVAGEPGGEEPVAAAVGRQGAQRDDRDPCRPAPGSEYPCSVRAVHVREPEVHQDHVRQLLGSERDPLCAA